MRVINHPEAEAELEAAAVWYDGRQQGLGIEFLNEFEYTLRRLLIDPERYHKIEVTTAKSTSVVFLSQLFIAPAEGAFT